MTIKPPVAALGSLTIMPTLSALSGIRVVDFSHVYQGPVGTQLLAAYESVAAERGAERVYARAEPGARAESFLSGRGWAREDPPPMVRGRIGPVG